MEKKFEVEVQIVSDETVKPSLPPTSHPKTLTLSLLDQIFPAISIPVLLFYNTTTTATPQKVDISGLKTSLSQTLNQFYPLAGRLLDESTVSCNDQGIPFIETKTNCHLSVIFNSPHKLKFLTELLPSEKVQPYGTGPISELVPLVIQVNVFQCGGVVIGLYMLHKLLDIASLGTFLKRWAALASNRCKDLVQPDFEATVKVFPPLPRLEQVSLSPPTDRSHPVTVVVKSFVFNTVALNNLKATAASDLVPKPSKFEAVAAFLWEHTLAAARSTAVGSSNSGARDEDTVLSFTVNMRPRMNPPVPTTSMGNCVTNVQAHADKSNTLHHLVEEIHSVLPKIKKKINKINKGKNGGEVFWAERKAETQVLMGHEKSIYRLSSWCNMGLNEADFGFGKPVWILPVDGRPPSPMLRNFTTLTDYSHPSSGDGIEAWVFLEKKEMQNLETNPNFLAFASPN